MAQPTGFNRDKNFVDYQAAHTDDPYNPADHDSEWVAVETTIDGILSNLLLIQRDDGKIGNQQVHPDSLSSATLALIAAAGNATGLAELVAGLWVTATLYTVGKIVQEGTTSYICSVEHTSGTFATDYAADKWIIFGDTTAANAAALPFTPVGNIAATDVQAAIQELDDEKASLNGDAAEIFEAADSVGSNDVVNMGQIQKNSTNHVVCTGTGDALLATLVSGLTTLADGMVVTLEAPGSNTVSAPTLNLTLGVTATGAVTIVKGNGTSLVAGDIASNKIQLCYNSTLVKWVLLNTIFPIGASSSDAAFSAPKNLGIAFGVSASELTASLKTAGGSNATATDKVSVPMRSATLANGTFVVREVSTSLSMAISSGSTLGHLSAVEGAIHWYLIDNAGTLELAASTYYHGDSGIITTVAEGGAGAADSALSMYSTSARTSVSFQWIAKTLDTQTTAGTWAAVPTTVQLSMDVDLDAITSVLPMTQELRLTLTTAVPVTTSDVTAATEIFLTPYKGNRIALYNGLVWETLATAEVSTGTLTATNAKPYDVFAYNNSGTVTLETLVWTNDTTRATALVRQDGILCKTGDLTRRYLGTFYTSATNQTEDSLANRFLFNYYNRVTKEGRGTFSTDRSTTSTTYTEVNSEIRVNFIIGISEDSIRAYINGSAKDSVDSTMTGVGFDGATAEAGLTQGIQEATPNLLISIGISGIKSGLSVGKHYATLISNTSVSGTSTYIATESPTTGAKVYLQIEVKM